MSTQIPTSLYVLSSYSNQPLLKVLSLPLAVIIPFKPSGVK